MTDHSAQRPQDIRFLSGLILVSEQQPDRLVDFYRDALGLPLAEEQHGDTAPQWACELGDVHLAIHPAAGYEGEPTATGAVKLAFMIFDMTRPVQWLQTRGVPLCYPSAEFGTQSRITAIRDPDGNLIELTELGPAWLDHLKEHRATGGDLVQEWQTRLSS
jgi:catechol 2,3-dioxygenase-like lactoylglutathione lyase family enzyme